MKNRILITGALGQLGEFFVKSLISNNNYVLATDIADYLVNKGMPFREAHSIVSKLSSIASSKGKKFSELPLSSYKELSDLFDSDVLEINLEKSISSKTNFLLKS